ncbi:MAG: transposase [Desulfovibrio sp.]|nr:transposase [Desulfovibrio sp.]
MSQERLFQLRWPEGDRCPRCGCAKSSSARTSAASRPWLCRG